MLKYSMLLQAIDRVSGPARRIQASMRSMGQGARRLARDLSDPAKAEQRGYAAGERLRAGLGRLAGGFATAGRAAKRWAGKAGLGSWGDAAEKAGRGVGFLLRKGAGLAAGAAKWAAAGATAAAGFAVFDLFKVAGQFEQYKIMLENMEGSAQAARKAFDWVKVFAQTTPYELADVMEAFVQLKAYGIDPMKGSLKALGDASAGMSKPIMQSVEALADAITGEYERLKEFGIRASKQGDKVSFTYRKAGKDITRTVKATGSEIEAALTGIFTDRFAGMMDKQSRTLNGIISNLKDQWSNFLVMVADAGIFDLVKSKLDGVLAKVNQWAKDGTLKRWAEQVSAWLERAFLWAEKLIRNTDWKAVGADLRTMADAAKVLADAIVTAARYSGQIKFAADMAMGPLGWFNQARKAGVFGSDKAPAALPRSVGPQRGVPRTSAPWPATRGQGPITGAPLLRKPAKIGANDVKVGGRTQIDVRVTGPAQARVAAVKSDNRNVPLQVNLGRTMAAPA